MFSRIVSSFSNALDLNLATLSGCVDIIVVPQKDGTLKSTPFHVRFGKTKLLRSREKEVSVWVNGKETGLRMKLGAAGEAYFEEQEHPYMPSLAPANANSSQYYSCQEPQYHENALSENSPLYNNNNNNNNNIVIPLDSIQPSNYKNAEPSSSNQVKSTIHSSNEHYNDGIYKMVAPSFRDPSTYTTNPTSDKATFSIPGPDITNELSNPLQQAQPNSADSEASCVEFSICGHLLSGDRTATLKDNDCFNANILTWDAINKTPMLWYHPHLVCRFDLQPPFYPGKVALPLLASWITFNRPLSSDALRYLMSTNLRAEAAQDKGLMEWMFGSSGADTYTKHSNDNDRYHNVSASSHGNESTPTAVYSRPINEEKLLATNSHTFQHIAQRKSEQGSTTAATSGYSLFNECNTTCGHPRVKRTLRPTEKQLSSLDLKPGVNSIEFKVTSSLQGPKTVSGSIYLWPMHAKIIVSDVDGTITKSDVLGQLMPIVGRDWSHQGVADLFSKCRDNNYRILYLTARAIGQADSTRDYLFGLRQDDSARLPDGPLIMSPDRLFPSFKREVIERKPYVFKIAALRDVRHLFPQDYNPFYAGFGNRDTDHRAYVHIGIPEHRVFIIDPKGTLHHINTTFAKTYESMGAISEHMFPPLRENEDSVYRAVEEQFNDLNYWRVGYDYIPIDEDRKDEFDDIDQETLSIEDIVPTSPRDDYVETDSGNSSFPSSAERRSRIKSGSENIGTFHNADSDYQHNNPDYFH